MVSTVDHSRLYVADTDGHYMGNINSYNNWFTRLFAFIGQKSMKVDFNGKTRTVNKISYEKFLRVNGIETNQNHINEFAAFQMVLMRRRPNQPRSFMRDHLSTSKTQKLLKKLVFAMVGNNEGKVQQLALKGANINGEFWDRGRYGFTTSANVFHDLPQQVLDFRATKYTPILYAAETRNVLLVPFFQRLNANLRSHGQTISARRSFSHIENRVHVERSYVPVYYGRRRTIYAPQADIYNETIVHYRDTTKQLQDHYLDENLRYISRNVNRPH